VGADAVFFGIERLERGADHTTEVKNEWICTYISHVCLYDVCRDEFTFWAYFSLEFMQSKIIDRHFVAYDDG
jgi:hypothetical protein